MGIIGSFFEKTSKHITHSISSLDKLNSLSSFKLASSKTVFKIGSRRDSAVSSIAVDNALADDDVLAAKDDEGDDEEDEEPKVEFGLCVINSVRVFFLL